MSTNDSSFSAEDVLLALACSVLEDGPLKAETVRDALVSGGFESVWETAKAVNGETDESGG